VSTPTLRVQLCDSHVASQRAKPARREPGVSAVSPCTARRAPEREFEAGTQRSEYALASLIAKKWTFWSRQEAPAWVGPMPLLAEPPARRRRPAASNSSHVDVVPAPQNASLRLARSALVHSRLFRGEVPRFGRLSTPLHSSRRLATRRVLHLHQRLVVGQRWFLRCRGGAHQKN
jgi:hypothetical protein